MCYNEEVLEDVVASVEDQVPVDQSLLLHICCSLSRYHTQVGGYGSLCRG
jgi:hypothetical protein